MQRQRPTLREFQPSNQELGGRRTPSYPVPHKAPHSMVITEATIQCMSARSQIFRGGRFSCPYVFMLLLHTSMYIGSPIAIKGALPFEVLRDAPSYDRATPSGQTESAKKPNGRGALSRCKTGTPQRHATRILMQRGQEAGRTAWTQSFIAPFTPCETLSRGKLGMALEHDRLRGCSLLFTIYLSTERGEVSSLPQENPSRTGIWTQVETG